MGSSERGSRRVQLWRKATVHFSLCFVMGFLTGFAPTGNPRKFSEQVSKSFPSGYPPEPEVEKIFRQPESHNFDGKKAAAASQGEERSPLLIIVTPTSKAGAPFRGALLGRLASTLKLVAQPFLWVVVEQNGDDSEASEVLRRTGIMYRYIVSKENFSNADTEMDHQRNLALFHIEQHRLTGLVLFAELSTVFDLALFSEMRAIQGFGAWPVAKLSPSKYRVRVEGPVCDDDDSEITGWHLNKEEEETTMGEDDTKNSSPIIHVSSFAFNSSTLWDPERWGRRSPYVGDFSQNSVEFLKKEILEEEKSHVKGIIIPAVHGCSRVLAWNLQL